jgi:hypothetical protein
MRRAFLLWTIGVVCLGLGTLNLEAQPAENDLNADQIIESNIQAVGGREALAAINDRTLKGTLTVMGMSGSMEWHEKLPNKVHQTVDMEMAVSEVWFDGETGYRNDPMQGPAPFSEEELNEWKQNYVISPMLTYKERGEKARYDRTEELNGRQAHVVEITNPQDKKMTFWFDASNSEILKIIAPLPSREGPGEQEILLSDYREVGEVRFPFKLVRSTSAMQVEISFDSIEVNTGLEDSLFTHQVP